MNRPCFLILLLFLSAGCSTGDQHKTNLPPALFTKPVSVPLVTDSSYSINPITGKPVQPVEYAGDPIKSGIPVPIKGIVPEPEDIQPPLIKKIGQPKIIETSGNVSFPAGSIGVIPLKKDSLLKRYTNQIHSNFLLISTKGDTLPTGIPIPAEGEILACHHPEPVTVQPALRKDQANIDLRYLDVAQGLNTSFVRDVLEDSRGNIWIANNESGITQYNGEIFLNYTSTEGLVDNQIRTLFEDSQGNIWIGAENGGISKFDGSSFTNYQVDNGLSGRTIWCIYQDQKGHLWFGTEGSGVTEFDGNSFTHHTTREGLSHNDIRAITGDESGNLWFGTYGGGVCKYDGSSITEYNTTSGLNTGNIVSLLVDSRNSLWIGTDGGGAIQCTEDTIHLYTLTAGISSHQVLDIEEDEKGNIWFATMEGLNKYDGHSIKVIAKAEGLASEIVTSIDKGRNGNLWLGTVGGGLNILNTNSFVHYTTEDGLSENKVLAIEQDYNQNYWFGTLGGGLIKFDGKTYSHYTDEQGLRHNFVFALESDRKGNLWISNYPGGVSKFDGENLTVFGVVNGLSGQSVFTIFEDSSGRIWFGTNRGGVTMLEGDQFTHFTKENGLPHNLIRAITEDRNGNIWFGSAGGAIKFDGTSFTHYTEREGLSHNHVASITEDSAGNLWFGTRGGGVMRFDGDNFLSFTEKQGISNNFVRSVVEDQNQRIWVTTDNGINLILFDENGESSVRSFSRGDGLKGTDFYTNSAFIDQNNTAFWGNGKSLTKLELKNFNSVSKPPTVELTHLTIHEKFIDFNHLPEDAVNEMEYDQTSSFCNYPIGLKLPSDYNHLVFSFSAIDWSAPHRIRYSYIMEGLNAEWSEITPNTFADYRNLPYGDFTFKVRAMGAGNEWGQPFEYHFTILPPWYHTWWARAGYVLLAAFLIMRITQWRTYHLRKSQQDLEQKIEHATEELRHQKLLVEKKNQSITDSITYAKRIQEAILPPLRIVEQALKESFIIYKPKDIVAGDFYWIETLDVPESPDQHQIIFAVADCTGHGVPGAMVSVLCSNALNRAVMQFNLQKPAKILDKTRDIIIEHFERSEDVVKDGMDIALCSYKPKTRVLNYAGAQNPLWIVSRRAITGKGITRPFIIANGELVKDEADSHPEEFKLYTIAPNRQPIGNYSAPLPFTNHTIQLEPGDSLYLFSDGYADQFGGPKGKKFKYRPLKQMLLSIQNHPMDIQRKIINERFEDWRGNLEQIDDICAIGMRVI